MLCNNTRTMTFITEMKKIRHYYDKGVMGREGIED